VDIILGIELEVPGSIHSSGKRLCVLQPSVLYHDVKHGRPNHRITFSMGHTGASEKYPQDASWEILS